MWPWTEHFYCIKRIKQSQVTTADGEMGGQAGKHTAGTAGCPHTPGISQLPAPLGGTMELQCRAPTAAGKAATTINPLLTCCCCCCSSAALYEEMIYFCGRELLKGKPQNILTRISVTYVLCQTLPIRKACFLELTWMQVFSVKQSKCWHLLWYCGGHCELEIATSTELFV